ncbi:MAG TPA: DUF3426 domain-containing protein [Rhizomicrobium sp.]|jgi:predicted Zn finger-like uncharacterized protein|nr:DUF3426 domain-containing protein [Rhizomicrobium sp.]
MILTCPQCATRYEADAAKFPAQGRNVRCAKCSHVWHQAGPDADGAVPEPEAFVPPTAETAPDTDSQVQSETEVPEDQPGRVPNVAPRDAEEIADADAAVPAKKSFSWGLVFGWIGLAAIVAIIAAAAVNYREQVAALWPQSATAYSAVGAHVNARGIAFAGVNYKRENQDGQAVLAVTGKLVNVSTKELPVPEIRVVLMDEARHELYHWDFAATVPTLKPGQEVPFLTRLSSPPPKARHLQVRFANGSG